MKTMILFITVIMLCSNCYAQNDVPSADVQIKAALLAAPKEKKDSCTVYGYDTNKQFILLRKGTNELICLADDPNQAGFSVSCYHKDLEPFMQRGRELRKQGMNDQQVYDAREKEVKDGSLQMPKQPAALYVYSAEDKDFDHATGEVTNGYLRYVIYIPYATSASTGLPEKPTGKGMPWIMNPGTYRAHIMINP
ncbi:hypothetical protein FRZ67_13715 [Panacibacter ginsenosidivorans]|uniref:Uncharacterized protein n=1 Tax=Panacibacter ginsenosidivorans TaxID=1813871 RepID=A0A5B8VAY7_9BACT|nr:hypothetical protein [Panacibacter ginsenosidivorans]QEC68305.1 hypothetical protein FRZ67_13715 [Panacibacter ginsenosidivorans]